MSDIGGEVGKPTPRDTQVADRWLRMQGVKKPEEAKPTEGKTTQPENPQQLITEAYDLFVERDDLKSDIVRKQRETEPQATTKPLTLEERRAKIQQGKIGDLLRTTSAEPIVDVVTRSQARITEIETRLDQVFSAPGLYDKFKEDLSHQVRIRHQAREVNRLEGFVEQVDITAIRLAREAQVQGRALTTIERQMIEENKALAEIAGQRRQELLKDTGVFDKVRVQDLQEYQKQLRVDGFAETPSRKNDLARIRERWAIGRAVLLTGPTGTGKTEMAKHASNSMFGEPPEIVRGNEDTNQYDIIGRVGFKVGEGDVRRPGSLIAAMMARGGKGKPCLIDEMDRIPTKQAMAAKELYNVRPGQKGVKPYPDGEGNVDVGLDYAVIATGNIKGEKHTTATDLDPAIVRIFAPSFRVNYMPAYEVYDLALASLMDTRGGVSISENDAKVTLKNLCDAASWIQDAYQGRKVVTDPATGAFLEARGQATTGKEASLKKAVIDPGMMIDIVKGWSSGQIKGTGFEEFVNGKLIELINTETYPEEDRYYLTEIFALKGFLKGHKASELMVSGLTQETLDRWSGNTAKKTAFKKGSRDYLSASRVAKLDPYGRFKRPVLAEAEELLSEEAVEAEELQVENLGGMMERAKEILGKDFLGKDAIRMMGQKLKAIGVNVEFDVDKLPAFTYTEQDLQLAKQNGEMLVLRLDTMLREGREVPITLREFQELLKKDPLGKSGSPFYHFSSGDWYTDEKFFKTVGGEIKLQWALVKKEVLDGSLNQTWNDQETLLKQYQDGLKKNGATSADIKRRTATETAWDTMLYYTNTGERLLGSVYDRGQTRSSFGSLVYVGYFDSAGLSVVDFVPGSSLSVLGVCPSR